jgi:molybdopterin-binding protein
MQLSARNQFAGRVKEVKLGNIMAEIVTDIGGGHEVVAAITRGSAERMGLAQGSVVTVVIKATEVLVAKD